MLLLPVQTRSQLRSSQILTSLVQVVSELVQNSLDAGARHVGVGVDTEGWSCWVRDDGVGLSIEGMALLAKGSEEGRYGMFVPLLIVYFTLILFDHRIFESIYGGLS
jgi:DNA mismatch repair protein MLH3